MSRAIQTPGPSEQLEARYGIKGAIALRLDEVVAPVEVIRPPVLRGAIGQLSSGAQVGFRSEIIIVASTPGGGPAQQIEVTRVTAVLITAAGRIDFVRPDVAVGGFTNSTVKSFKKLADGSSPSAFLQLKNTAAATAGAILMQQLVPTAGISFTFDFTDDPWVLGAGNLGNVLMIRPSIDNAGIRVVFEWREPAFPI